MNTFKLISLTIITLLFGASSLYSYNRDLDLVRYVSETIKGVGWASSELEKEVLKFDHALTALAAHTADEEDVQLRFELLWGRIDTLLQGKENRPMREQPGVKPMLENFVRQLEDWEKRIYALQADDRTEILALRQELAHFRRQAREINVDNFSGDHIWRQLDVTQNLRLHSSLYLGGLLLSGGLMLWMLVRENRRNRYMAYHDMLTDLPNRMSFYQLMSQALNRAQRNKEGLAVHMVDLNSFKAINDTLGHKVGDRLLQEISVRLRDTVGKEGQVARLGGDEFVVIQPFAHIEEARQMATQLSQSLSRDVALPDGCLLPQACIGTSLYPAHGTTTSELLSHADTAMYYAKQSRKVMVQMFEPGMDEQRLRRQKLAVSLQAAIEQDQLTLHYQPIFRLDYGAIESVEALLRWHSDEHGTVSPLELIAVAEQHGLAHRLNDWVLSQACRQLHLWHQAGYDWLKVNVNISPNIFMNGELAPTVSRILHDTGLDASTLVLEITEDTSLWDTAGSLDNLQELRQLGIEIALDDFGTGYSSFSHLRQLPVSKLKIDKSFVSDLSTDPRAVSLVKTIISLAESLDMAVTAEGIELPEQLEQLQVLGCRLGQGYLLARPMSVEAMSDTLLQGKPPHIRIA